MKINYYIDHTLLKPTATKKDIINLCNEAKEYQFHAVCVNGCYVALAKKQLKNSSIKVAAVVGFPLGAMSSVAKTFEALHCVKKGASEIDMVINVGKMIEGDHNYIENEIREIKQAIGNTILKVILENCYLNNTQIQKACELVVNAGADFVKTSTGFGTSGATTADVKLMKASVNGKVQIKAAGGIKDIATAKRYIEMGVTRLGTSSGVALIENRISKEDTY